MMGMKRCLIHAKGSHVETKPRRAIQAAEAAFKHRAAGFHCSGFLCIHGDGTIYQISLSDNTKGTCCQRFFLTGGNFRAAPEDINGCNFSILLYNVIAYLYDCTQGSSYSF
jgi:hypothetical protein